MNTRILSLKLETGFYIAFLFLLTGFIVVGSMSYISLNTVDQKRQELTEHYARALALLNHVRFLHEREHSVIMQILVSADMSADKMLAKNLENVRNVLEERLTQLEDTVQDPNIDQLIEVARAQINGVRKIYNPLIEQRLSGMTLKNIPRPISDLGRPQNEELEDTLNKIFDDEISHFTKVKAEVDGLIAALKRNFLAVAGLLLVGFIGISLLLKKLLISKADHEKTRERLLNQTEILAKARKEVLETVAHDLKNPLGNIKMSVDMLLEEQPSLPEKSFQHQGLQIIQRASRTMESLIGDLLDHSKIEAGRLVLEKKHIRFDLLIEEILFRNSPLFQNKKIAVETKIDIGELQVVCDEHRIDQVISNLLSNAIKFSPTGGRIKVEAKVEDKMVCLSISDNGSGIPNQQLPFIFERHWQVKETSKYGNGLGLSIAQGIAQAHGGRIEVVSQLGSGSTFTLILPNYEFAQSGREQTI